MAEPAATNFIELGRLRLGEVWKQVQSASGDSPIDRLDSPEIAAAIRRSINSPTKTYRYVLPTQLLAKTVDRALDCRCVQAGSGLPGAFDARSLCHDVVVEFDRRNNNVLGGSTEPYINNPLRISAIIPAHRSAQKNKDGFDDLCLVLDYAQAKPRRAELLLSAVLAAILERLALTRVVYPVPNRVSLAQTQNVLASFLSERTGGLRLQAVAVALFGCIGKRFGLYRQVRHAPVNAADASTGGVADLECINDAGQVVLAVEVKDRMLTLRHTQDKLPSIREKGVKELLFLVQGGVETGDRQAVKELMDREFVTGQNVYVSDFDVFVASVLVLLSESGRRDLLGKIGEQLEEGRADLSHRRRWADLLAQL